MNRPVGVTPLPSGYNVQVLQHQFFLTGRTLTRACEPPSRRPSRNRTSSSRVESYHLPHCSNELALQEYSTEIQNEMRRYLPHVLQQTPVERADVFKTQIYGNIVFEPLRGQYKLWDSGAGSLGIVYAIAAKESPATLEDLRTSLDALHSNARATWHIAIQNQAKYFRTTTVPGYLQAYISDVGGRSLSVVAEPGNDCLTENADSLWVHDAIFFVTDGDYERSKAMMR